MAYYNAGRKRGLVKIQIQSGGTGASTAADARTNLSVYSKAEVDALILAATT